MYLKRLEIQGFKSFANKTILEFLPPLSGRFSITAIVGPNGAGKSNVSDAIRWVMGEQSLKVLRGKKSEDVIFGGSETKSQLGAAEVSLVLDNSDAKVLQDYPEIIITRRLYRSGEGEYLINNNLVRLFDIHLLLAQAQFGQHSYSVVGQGMIDKLLTVTPAERKDFLDEASGIKEFQIKRHQANLKLARTKENMEQAERLLQEVEPRLKILARQVKKLEKRQEVEMSLREIQEKYYTTIYNRNQKEIDSVTNHLKDVDDSYHLAFVQLEKVQTELAELSRSSSRQEVFQELQNRYQEAVRTKNSLEKQLAILEGQMHTEYGHAGKQNIGWLEEKIKELKENHKKIVNDLSLANAEADRLNRTVDDEKSVVENLAVERMQKVLKISRLQSEMMKDQSEQNYRELSGLTAVKAVLESKEKFGKVYGLVAELGEVGEEYRVALEVAAGQHLSSLVVGDEQVARMAINYLRENRFGVATFLPLNKVQGRPIYNDMEMVLKDPNVLGLAQDFIQFDNKFKEIFSFIFGATVVVKDLKAAEAVGIGRARMVTLSGDLAEKNGVMRGGFRQKRNNLSFSSKLSLNNEGRLAEYQAEISLEQHGLNELERKIDEAKMKSVNLQVQSQSALSKAQMLNGESDRREKELANLERELAVHKSSPEEYGAELKKLSKEKDIVIVELESRENEVKNISEEISVFNQKEEEKKQRVFALQIEMQKKQEEVNKILSERNDLKIQSAKMETKQEDLVQEVYNEMNTALSAIIERKPDIVDVEVLESLVGEIQKLKYQLSLIGGIDEEVTEEYKTTKERFDFLDGQLDDLSKATEDLTKMIEELDELMKKKRGAAFKKIKKEFDRYFKILFDGGSADLEEIYGEEETDENLVQDINTNGDQTAPAFVEAEEVPVKKKEKILTGIEVLVNPPGKKIKHINALSGGERTLTSIALICAILNCNPSPFVVLDEVEAALDEANTGRFVRIMSELSTQSQFVIISHNRVTMHAADALYGVVMGGDGISKLLSVKMEEAEQYDQVARLDNSINS